MTREEKQKAIDALKISAPFRVVTQEEFKDYIQTINQVRDWLEQEPTTKNDLGVDCISRVDALDSIAIMCSAEELDIDFAKLLLLQRAIKALSPVTPQDPKWIPVSERLPTKEEYIANNGLFIVSDGNRTYAEYFDVYNSMKYFGEPTMNGFRVDRCVIAWMSLPEPYKMNKESKG